MLIDSTANYKLQLKNCSLKNANIWSCKIFSKTFVELWTDIERVVVSLQSNFHYMLKFPLPPLNWMEGWWTFNWWALKDWFIRKKRECIGRFKKASRVIHFVRMQNFPRNQNLLPADSHMYVCVSRVRNVSFPGKFAYLLNEWCLTKV